MKFKRVSDLSSLLEQDVWYSVGIVKKRRRWFDRLLRRRGTVKVFAKRLP